MTRSRPYLRLLSALCFILLLPAGPGLLEAGQKDKCEGTKKQRKQKMDLREVTAEKLAALVEGYKLTVSAEREQIADTVLRRLEREYLESTTTGEPFVFDVLILSGGGAKGAFGAGFLEGWTSITSGPAVRPEFDMVTGVSTGALIGPFAFTGTNTALAQVGDFYSNPEPNWVRERGKFSTLPHHASLFNTCHLQEVIREKVDEELVRSLAVGAAENRLLLVGATNLDAGRGRRFDLTHEAQIALESGSFDRIHDILLASTAIPGVFPPVEIDQM